MMISCADLLGTGKVVVDSRAHFLARLVAVKKKEPTACEGTQGCWIESRRRIPEPTLDQIKGSEVIQDETVLASQEDSDRVRSVGEPAETTSFWRGVWDE